MSHDRRGRTGERAAVVLVALAATIAVLGCEARPTTRPSVAPSVAPAPASAPARPNVTTSPVGAGLSVAPPNPGALAQIDELRRLGRTADAALIQSLIETPTAAWFSGGSPAEVEDRARDVVHRSGDAVPMLVAYNVPGRDCSQYSAGGAATGDAYRAWIAAFSAGIGDGRAIVIVEPDGLALQPGDCGQPDTFDRSGLIAAAVDLFRTGNPNARVYLDGGHSAWHPPAEMAARLVRAGVNRASGFFLNASNYRSTPELVAYGRAVSTCIARSDATGGCPDSTAGAPADADLPPFVVDTSRNGQGPWTPGTSYADPQDWCNPPGRGLGLRPTLETGDPLVDAYLWIKVPGESDGTCTRGAAAGSADPVWGLVDPDAGHWFPEQALELARLADPPLGG